MRYVVILIALVFLFPILEAEAHTAKVLDDFKIDVGWQKEPPIAGEKNAIEIIIKLATDYDKQRYDPIYGVQKGEKSEGAVEDISGLAENLEVEVAIGNKEVFVTLMEDQNFPGVYHGEYIPPEAGDVTVNIYGIINQLEFEATFHPEKVEVGEDTIQIPSWIKINAGLWADETIDDQTFVSGIQWLVSNGILKIPQTTPGTDSGTSKIPSWIKTNAGWWAEGTIDDQAFVSGIQWLVSNGIIVVK